MIWFGDRCICSPPSTVGMGERAGLARWYLEHYNHEDDGRYLGCSRILNV
jgi:hypothetical protein